jgi:hypothetical protein
VPWDASDNGGTSWQGVKVRFPVLFEEQVVVLARLDSEMGCTRFPKGAVANLNASSGRTGPQGLVRRS